MTTLIDNTQSLAVDAIVHLYRIDLSSFGGSVYYVTDSSWEDESFPVFGEVEYTPIDMVWSDMEISGQGQMPTPKITLSNTNSIWQQVINSYGGDILGASVQRIRTFRKFLDDGDEPDPTAYFGPDWFLVERRVSETPIQIEWELSASFDQEGVTLPKRTVIRDTCTWRYRVYNSDTNDFDYTKAQCPYTGTDYFDRSGNSVSISEDRCGRKLTDCELRFADDTSLPFGGFPGAARIQGYR